MRIYDHTGKKYGSWTVISMSYAIGNKTYTCKCDCGKERFVNSRRITRELICHNCKTIQNHNSHSGEKHGNVTCLGYSKAKSNRHGFSIKCDCENIFTVDSYSQFLNISSCFKCRMGNYPGKRSGNSILIEHINNRKWKKRCDCGTIFIGESKKKNCGCIAKKKVLEAAKMKIGKKYHYLTVKSIFSNKNRHIQLLIRCKCGKEFIRNNGHEFKSRSCGCELTVPVGEKSNKATLKNCEVLSIRELYASGIYSIGQLSLMFNKKEHYLMRIIRRQIWKHI